MNNINVYSEGQQFESDYLPLISFKTEQQQTRAEEYIFKKAELFFQKIIKIDINIIESHIPYSKVITEQDFSQKEMKYFYKTILYDLGERFSDTRGRLKLIPKWGITFDEKCAPIIINWLSPDFHVYRKTNMNKIRYKDIPPHYRYGTIDINGQPIFYYIYFTLQELLDVIKE